MTPIKPRSHESDPIQDKLAGFTHKFSPADIPAPVIHAATSLIIDTLGVLIAGFPYQPCQVLRAIAERAPSSSGASVIGTSIRTSIEMAAFVNGTTARYAEANDVYARFRAGRMHGHPSDVIMPLLAVAEARRCTGRDFVASVVLAYEIYLWLCDVCPSGGFDPANFGTLAIALGAGRMMRLDEVRLRHAIAMAVVPNNILKQVRADQLSPWKAVAAGHAGRSGVFAAELAAAGLSGPNLPFEGKSGWCEYVAGGRLDTSELEAGMFRILGARAKPRPARALTIAAIQAAERVRLPPDRLIDVARVVVEVHKQAAYGTHAEHWLPDSRATADHSIPFCVSSALVDGTVTVKSFDDDRIGDPRILGLIGRMTIAENAAFSDAFKETPQHYRARVTVELVDGSVLSAESGGDEEDVASPKSDTWFNAKFLAMTEEGLGESRSTQLVERLWNLSNEHDMSDLPPLLNMTSGS